MSFSMLSRLAARHEARYNVHDQRKDREASNTGDRNPDHVRLLQNGVGHDLQDQAPNSGQIAE